MIIDLPNRPVTFGYENTYGLLDQVTAPTPGTTETTGTVTTSYTYDFMDGSGTLGNITQLVSPGPDGAHPVTVTYAYAGDTTPAGSYSQTPAIGQPLAVHVCDSSGNSLLESHYRYNRALGLVTATLDAQGNETVISYVQEIGDSLQR